MNNEERGLAVRNATMVTSDIFGESKARRMTSLNLNDEEQLDMYLNAQSDADFKLNDCAGQVITFVGAIIGEYPNETTNEETGEVIIRKKHSLCLFDEDGKLIEYGKQTTGNKITKRHRTKKVRWRYCCTHRLKGMDVTYIFD